MVNFIRFSSKLFFTKNRIVNIPNKLFCVKRNFCNQVENKIKMEKIIAIGQMRSTNNKLDNRQQVKQIVESATQENACVSALNVCVCL